MIGIEKFFSSIARNNYLVLCYHGCSYAPDFSINGRHISSKQMEEHLIYFKKNFNIVSLSECFFSLRNGIVPKKKTIALTFDDGYVNNFTTLFPLLKKINIPATFFIISQSLVDDNFINWPDILDIIKSYSGTKTLEIGDEKFKLNGNFFSNKLSLSASDYIKKMGSDRDAILRDIMNKCGFAKIIPRANREYYKMINKEQLKQISENALIEIGSHSHSHYNLGNVNNELAKEELIQSKKIIEEVIQKEVETIAYPDGSYTNETKRISEEAGYKNLVAVSYQCTDDLQDKRILPRLTISNTTTFESNMIQVNLGFGKRGF
ncbi:MAG: polysaccharide deacetylase family protein [Bacteroidetes bacterium]|nr:polysaccharide deacetylase family protein [Bacteroidota bacterium]